MSLNGQGRLWGSWDVRTSQRNVNSTHILGSDPKQGKGTEVGAM